MQPKTRPFSTCIGHISANIFTISVDFLYSKSILRLYDLVPPIFLGVLAIKLGWFYTGRRLSPLIVPKSRVDGWSAYDLFRCRISSLRDLSPTRCTPSLHFLYKRKAPVPLSQGRRSSSGCLSTGPVLRVPVVPGLLEMAVF